ncbi:MAG: hypothetical protein VKN72_01605 [Nostocales cyanobacterium 94392]|nr:hypothetical protein [Nostocales cyanobacterium 94392]
MRIVALYINAQSILELFVVRYIQFYLDFVKAIAIHHIQIKFRDRENTKSQFRHLSQIMRSLFL